MAIAKTVRNFVVRNDLRVMRSMNRWRPPRWLRFWTLLVTRLGDGWVWYALGIILLIAGGERSLPAFDSGLCSSLVAILVFRKLKGISQRPRPCQVEPHCWSMLTPPDRFSFPSGHAMTSFAVAISVGHFYPDLEWFLLALAISIALSRIILGMHYLTDVIVGSAIGIGLAYASVCIFS